MIPTQSTQYEHLYTQYIQSFCTERNNFCIKAVKQMYFGFIYLFYLYY